MMNLFQEVLIMQLLQEQKMALLFLSFLDI